MNNFKLNKIEIDGVYCDQWRKAFNPFNPAEEKVKKKRPLKPEFQKIADRQFKIQWE
jgi:hypothetical protein